MGYSLLTGILVVGRRRKASALTEQFAHFAKTVLVANTISGLIIGVLARLAMSLVTVAGGFSTTFPANQFTVAGTVNILLTPIFFGIPFAALLIGLRRFIPGTGRRKLLVYGFITFVFPGLLVLSDDSFYNSAANQTVGMLTFIPITFLYGLLIGVVVERLDRRAPVAARAA